MKATLKKLFNSCKGAIDITGVVVDVVLVTALIPVIVTFIGNAKNLTATETTLLGLTTLFISSQDLTPSRIKCWPLYLQL